jgi:hypothetical protein
MKNLTDIFIWLYAFPVLCLIPIYHLYFKKEMGKANQSQFKGIALMPMVNLILIVAFVIAYGKYLIDLLLITMKKK